MTEIDFNNYQLFNGGYRVYTIPSSSRVLCRDPDCMWFMAQHRDGLQFTPVTWEQKVLTVGSIQSIASLCQKFASSEAALAAKPWEC
jgi:hypothetical protein